MSMLDGIWFDYLYRPLFNALIWIYMNIAEKNLGWAVVWLTVFLRVVLLPLTIISERDALRQKKVEEEAGSAVKAFKNDTVAQKEEIRKIMRKNHVSPWAKVMALGLQLLVLVLLYQVFVRGITGEKIVKLLYSWVDFPGKINTYFYGFNIGDNRDALWAGIVALYLFFSIYLGGSKNHKKGTPRTTFLFIFPLFTFVVLWFLPMVKSLFILTSMLFSDIITLLRKMIFPEKEPEPVKVIKK